MAKWFSTLRMRLRGLFRAGHVSHDILNELQDHVRAEAHSLETLGMTAAEARAEAGRRFGSFDRIQRECHDAYFVKQKGSQPMMLMRDLRYAIRSLRQNPGFSIVAIATLALGIGGNTGMFALVHGVVLRPLAYDESEQLVQVWHKYENVGLLRASVSPANFRDYQREDIFEKLTAFVGQNYTITGRGNPFRLTGMRATPDLFSVLRVTPALGRAFAEDEDEPGAVPVAMLSHGTWQARFGGDESVLGESVILNGVAHDIVGVLPADFQFLGNADIIAPLVFTPDQLSDERRGMEFLSVTGRLREGVVLEAARTHMDAVAVRIDEEYTRGGYGIDIIPLHQQIIGTDVQPALMVLLGAVGFVLLIACVNLANLLYARAETRQREVALRTALGATRGQLVKQLLTESLLLGLLGGGLGLAFSAAGIKTLTGLQAVSLPRSQEIGIDGIVLAFTVLLALGTGLIFGIGPALGLTRRPIATTLHEGGQRNQGDRRGTSVRRGLIVAEVALATVLLTGAGLMLKSFGKLAGVDPGYDTVGLQSLRVDLPTAKYQTPNARSDLYGQILERVGALPGVASTGGIMPTPMSGANSSGSFMIEGDSYDTDTPIPNTKMRYATSGYFETMRIPIVAGRTFNEFDNQDSPRVVVVDEQFVRRYMSGRDPIGMRVGFPNNWSTIVGVVGDVQDVQLGEEINGHIYSAHAQLGPPFLGVIVRTDLPPNSLVRPITEVVHTLDPDLAPFDFQTMEDRVRSTIANDLFLTTLLTSFAAVALALAAIGVYGVLAYSMARQVNEIGVRSALGAQRRDLISSGLWEGMRPALLGAAIGLLGSAAATRWLRSQLFGVSEVDPTVFTVMPAILLTVALVASVLPVLRATNISPVEALRRG